MKSAHNFTTLAIAVAVTSLVTAGSTARAASLRVGDAAPPLAITKWLRGDGVDLAKAKGQKVVVVEFWAVWCPPCRTSIPHLTKLQKKYEKDAVIIGATKPDPGNTLEKVETFVKEWTGKMDYTVAFDGDGKTYEAYMQAAGQGGIPTAFIVDKSGKVAWIGHPMSMDKPLEQIVAGTFDVELEQIRSSLQNRLQDKARKGDFASAGRALDALIALDPTDPQPRTMKFQLHIFAKEFDKAGAAAKPLVDVAKDDEQALNMVAWTLLTNEALAGKQNELALSAAARAVELTKGESWMLLDTLALAQFENGKKADAAKTQRKAIELAKKDGAPAGQLEELEGRLEKFED